MFLPIVLFKSFMFDIAPLTLRPESNISQILLLYFITLHLDFFGKIFTTASNAFTIKRIFERWVDANMLPWLQQ